VLGSAGMVATIATALVAWSVGWRPATIDRFAAALPMIALGGLSLAAVLRSVDRASPVLVRRGDIVGRRARGVLVSLAGLEAHAHRAFVDPRSIHWLRRVLVAAADPEIAPWIPIDVRGRAELLLAREIAVYQGTAFTHRAAARGEVATLLVAASEHLDDASPARADLAALEAGPSTPNHRPPRAREVGRRLR